jgi:hypothetical protein
VQNCEIILQLLLTISCTEACAEFAEACRAHSVVLSFAQLSGAPARSNPQSRSRSEKTEDEGRRTRTIRKEFHSHSKACPELGRSGGRGGKKVQVEAEVEGRKSDLSAQFTICNLQSAIFNNQGPTGFSKKIFSTSGVRGSK